MKIILDLGDTPYTIKRNMRRLKSVGKKRMFTELVSIMLTNGIANISIEDNKGNVTPYVDRSPEMSPLQDALNKVGLLDDSRSKKNKKHKTHQTVGSK